MLLSKPLHLCSESELVELVSDRRAYDTNLFGALLFTEFSSVRKALAGRAVSREEDFWGGGPVPEDYGFWEGFLVSCEGWSQGDSVSREAYVELLLTVRNGFQNLYQSDIETILGSAELTETAVRSPYFNGQAWLHLASYCQPRELLEAGIPAADIFRAAAGAVTARSLTTYLGIDSDEYDADPFLPLDWDDAVFALAGSAAGEEVYDWLAQHCDIEVLVDYLIKDDGFGENWVRFASAERVQVLLERAVNYGVSFSKFHHLQTVLDRCGVSNEALICHLCGRDDDAFEELVKSWLVCKDKILTERVLQGFGKTVETSRFPDGWVFKLAVAMLTEEQARIVMGGAD